MSSDGTLTVLECLPKGLIYLKLLWLRLKESFATKWTFLVFYSAVFGEDPGEGGAGVKNDLNLLWWLTEPECAFISHIFKIFELIVSFGLRGILWVGLHQYDVAIFGFNSGQIQCLGQSHIRLTRQWFHILIISVIFIFNLRKPHRNHFLSIFLCSYSIGLCGATLDVNGLGLLNANRPKQNSNRNWQKSHFYFFLTKYYFIKLICNDIEK